MHCKTVEKNRVAKNKVVKSRVTKSFYMVLGVEKIKKIITYLSINLEIILNNSFSSDLIMVEKVWWIVLKSKTFLYKFF